ncbi:MAG: hypothetical protein KAX44_03135 [Candidatus Brocadiae bacterium]|nr:hypothetical protein [Candidatus Brocadiia bacterium]
MEVSRDLRRFLALLNAAGVRYLVTGGHAVVYYGYRRDPKDLDVWIPREPETAEKLVQALRALGVDDRTLTPQMVLVQDLLQIGQPPFVVRQKDEVATIGDPPFGMEVLLWVSDGTFEDCYQRRVRATMADLDVNFIGLEDLIISKKASNRAGDKEDLERLIAIRENR